MKEDGLYRKQNTGECTNQPTNIGVLVVTLFFRGRNCWSYVQRNYRSDCPHDKNDTVPKTWRYKVKKVSETTWHYAGSDLEVICDVGRPIDCIWGAWGDYGPCSKSCGGGVKLRTRMLAQEAMHGGSCSSSSSDLAECKIQECPEGNS